MEKGRRRMSKNGKNETRKKMINVRRQEAKWLN